VGGKLWYQQQENERCCCNGRVERVVGVLLIIQLTAVLWGGHRLLSVMSGRPGAEGQVYVLLAHVMRQQFEMYLEPEMEPEGEQDRQ